MFPVEDDRHGNSLTFHTLQTRQNEYHNTVFEVWYGRVMKHVLYPYTYTYLISRWIPRAAVARAVPGVGSVGPDTVSVMYLTACHWPLCCLLIR